MVVCNRYDEQGNVQGVFTNGERLSMEDISDFVQTRPGNWLNPLLYWETPASKDKGSFMLLSSFKSRLGLDRKPLPADCGEHITDLQWVFVTYS